MILDDIREVLYTINIMERDKINQKIKLWLSYNLLDNYNEFKNQILYGLGDNALIYIDGIPGNIYYVVFKYKDLYFSIYPLNEFDEDQVINISCIIYQDDMNNFLNSCFI
jgi:hypothetical protein